MRTLTPTYIVPRYWPNVGGAEQHSRALVQALAQRHLPRVMRFCSVEPTPTDYAYPFNATTRVEDGTVGVLQPGPNRRVRPLLQVLSGLARFDRASRLAYRKLCEHVLRSQLGELTEGSDLLHAIYNGFTPAVEAASRLGVPFVFTPLAHTTHAPGTAWAAPAFRDLYQRADALIAMTAYERDWLIARGAPSQRVHVCPMAPLLSDSDADPHAFRERHGLGDDPVILFMGRLVQSKGFEVLLNAAPAVWRYHPKARILFAGPAGRAARRALSRVDDARIRYLGAISDGEKNDVLAACDMVCIPSSEESLGVVYLEGWCFAKPAIAARIPVLETVISDGVDGRLVDRDSASVALAIVDLLDDPAKCREMGLAGQRKVGERYNWEAIASKHEAIYRRLVS